MAADISSHNNSTCALLIDLIKTVVFIFIHTVRACVLTVWPQKYKSIRDDIVLITGGGRGIGKELALQFAQHRPRHIILWGRHGDVLEEAASEVREYGVPCTAMTCDVSDRSLIYQRAQDIERNIGHVSILVNNAGIVYGHPILDSVDESIKKTLQVNTLANIWTLKCFMPHMLERNHGHIVSMNSIVGLMPLSGAGVYSMSKAASAGLVECVMQEMGESEATNGIHVTLVHPFQVNNGMFTGCQTRFPSLLPLLDEQYVAKRTMQAILTNQIFLMMPRLMYFLWWLNSWLPQKAIIILQKFIGADKAMSCFVHKND